MKRPLLRIIKESAVPIPDIEVWEVLASIANIIVLVFVVSCMLTAGLGLGLREIAAPLRCYRLVAASLLANFVIAPGLAWVITEIAPLHRSHADGLVILGASAGAPFLPKLAMLTRGDFAFSVALMLLLLAGSVVITPLILPILIPGTAANPWPLLRSLLITMLLPIAVGMTLRSRAEHWASRIRRFFEIVSNLSMIAALALLIGLNIDELLGTLGSGAALISMVFVTLTTASGYALGGPLPRQRSVLAVGTGQRNIAAAMLIATQNFQDPGVVVLLLVATIAGLVVLLLASWLMARAVSRSSLHEANLAMSGEMRS